MYGLWLFKEIQTEYGHCKVEIFRKGYSGSQIEIGALAANSLTISLENLSEITAPVGKSVCSFEIIDTDQIAYDDFFTPDATYYKVVVSTKVGTGAYVTRWSGYITPDFFAENLTYRTPISISARDNIGYLNDVDFDLTASSITVRELIQSAFRKIAADYPMSLSFVSQKQTAGGILAIEATISTLLLKEMSWGEALETILHDLGLQMRWVDNNTIAVLDLSQIPEYYPTQAFNFIHSSGYREIAPAWRQLSQSQDYGLRENFFEGWMRSDNLTFIKSQTIQTPDEYYGHDVRYYTPNNWGVARDIYTTDPAFYNSSFGEKIIFSAVSKDNPSTTYMSWSADILTSNKPLTIKFKAMNSVLYPYGGIKPYPLQLRLYDPFLAFARTPGDYLQIGMRFNLFLYTKDNTTYVMREDWVEDNGTGGGEYLNFTLDKISLDSYQSQEGSGSFPIGTRPSEKELTITANTIPYDGVLELRIYGYYVADYKFGAENGTSVSHNPNFDKFFAYINEPIYTFDNADIPTGQDTAVQINELHNVKGSQDYIFGEVPLDHGGINAYAGGLFKADGSELYGFQRNAEGQKYNLLELVGREIIHFNKDNYNRLSGTIKNLDKEPLMFNRLLVREGKTYYPYNCSLNVISNEMNITAMQEVEPYTTASFTEINSEVVTGGGATVGSGNNTVLQYSEEAGNVKRIYELEPATAEEIQDAEIIVDNEGWPEAKKYPASQLAPLLKRINVGTDEEPQWAVIPVDYEGKPVGIVSDTFITAGGKKSDDPNGTATTLGGLNNVDAAADDLQSEAVVLTKGVNATHWTLRALSTLGLNKAELETYLATNSYLKKDTADGLYTPIASFNELNTKVNDFLEGSDTDAIINKWKELEVFLAGQTESSTLAELLAIKANQSALDAHIANYNNFVNNTYATHIAAYNTHITDYSSFKNTTNDRLVALESLWAIDEENNALYPRNSRGIWSYDFITAGGKANSGSSSGGLIQAVYDYNNLGGNFNNNNLTDTFNAYAINSIYNEVQKLKESAGSVFNETALWQSLAKVDTTKVIDSSHIPNLDWSKITSGKPTTLVGYGITNAAEAGTLSSGSGYIKMPNPNGEPAYIAYRGGFNWIITNEYWNNSHTLIHTGNYADTTDQRYLQLSGGTISSSHYQPLIINSTYSAVGDVRVAFSYNGDIKGLINWDSTTAFRLYNYVSASYIGVKDDGTPCYNGYTLYHTGNFNPANYLPLSGGTISSDRQGVLSVNSNATVQTAINIDNANVNKGLIGWTPLSGIRLYNATSARFIGIKDDGTPYYHDGSYNTLIHSGNIGSYAMRYYGTNMPTAIVNYVGYGKPAQGWNTFGPAITWGYINYYTELQMENDSHCLYVRNSNGGALSDWKQIAYTDSNVASATKLQDNTAYTAWGQPFFQNGVPTSVTGKPRFVYTETNSSVITESASAIVLGSNGTGMSYNSGISFNGLAGYGGYDYTYAHHSHAWIGLGPYTTTNAAECYPLVFATNESTTANAALTERMRIMPNGNVLIGTTEDNGGKLQVAGDIVIKTDGGYPSFIIQEKDAVTGWALSYRKAEASKALRLYRVNNATYTPIVDFLPSGNVLIGTFKDNGYKLDVNGTLNAGETTLSILRVTNNTTIGGTLGVTGKSTLGELSANATTLLSLGVSGDTTLAGLSAGVTEVSSLISNGTINADGELITAGLSGTVRAGEGVFDDLRPIANQASGLYAGSIGASNMRWANTYLAAVDISGNVRMKPTNANYGSYLYFGDDSYCYIAELSDNALTIKADSGLNIKANVDASGNIFADGQVLGGQASDRKLKNNIIPMSDIVAYNVLKSLNPVTFEWNSTANQLGKLSGVSDGFIADEYEKLIPNSGRAIWTNYRAINYERTAGYLVKGWQMHETRLERLERENKELREEVEQLKQYRRA